MEATDTWYEYLLKRRGLSTGSGLVLICALSWLYLVQSAAGMAMDDMSMDMGGMSMMQLKPWTVMDFWLMFVMWTVMMVAMMLPSSAPMILIYSAIQQRGREDGGALAVGAFASGYLSTWIAFSLLATVAQWGLERAALLSPMMVSTSPTLGAVLLIAAGIYQFTPAKDVCLSHCRSPLAFITQHWQKGKAGALKMGVIHGAYCVGCCWILMGLLFVGGVMNLLWVAAIAFVVLLEKLLPFGTGAGRWAGGLLIAAGLALLVAGEPVSG
jgi:predicted metal-binding membrane protein